MLLTRLLSEHPAAIVDIVRQTPAWVGTLLAALLWLGLWATRPRTLSIARLAAMPLAMLGLALWGVVSAFAGGAHLGALLALWAVCLACVPALGRRVGPPAGVRFEAGARRVHLPGSWVPLGLILLVFAMKYLIGVQLALEPSLARESGFAFAITALYGLLSGVFAWRALRVLGALRAPGYAASA